MINFLINFIFNYFSNINIYNIKNMNTLALTKNNKINNYEFRLNLNPSFQAKNHGVSLQHLSIPFSWINISEKYQNNRLELSYNAYNTVIIIPDGFYTLEQLNLYIMSVIM